MTENVDTRHVSHPQIGDHQIVGLLPHRVIRVLAVLGLCHVVSTSPEHHGQRDAHIFLVVDDEYSTHVRSPFI